jgi:large subunit ribosomal protein L24
MKTKQPRKQRRQLIYGDLNRLKREMGAHLSKSLREKYKKRSITVRKGDDVKIMRGKFSGVTGVIERVNIIKGRIYIESVQVPKADGTKAKVGILPSNVMIIKLNLDDKRRITAPETKEKGAKE